MPRMRTLTPFLAAAALLAGAPVTAMAQQPSGAPDWRVTRAVGAGYLGSMPQALAGGTAYIILPWAGGIGFFGDYRQTHESYEGDAEFSREFTVQQAETEFGDDYMRGREHWRVFNVGLIRPMTPELAFFLGGGIARERLYAEYFDPTGQRGAFGHYRVEDTAASGNRTNVMGGAMFRFGRHLNFHFGGETAPAGFLAGASVLF